MERLSAQDISPVPDTPFSFEARTIMQMAREKAGLPEYGRLGDAHVGTEHVLLYLAQDQVVRSILRRTGIDSDLVVEKITTYIDHEDDNLPPIDDEGLTPTVVQMINNAKRLADRDATRVTTTHLYAGLIEAGRGKALMTLGGFLGFPEEDRNATPFIQDALFEHIPAIRREG